MLDGFASKALRGTYLPELVRMDGAAKSGGTWATEEHGGSDLRATFGSRAAIGPEPDPDHAKVQRLLGYAVIDFT